MVYASYRLAASSDEDVELNNNGRQQVDGTADERKEGGQHDADASTCKDLQTANEARNGVKQVADSGLKVSSEVASERDNNGDQGIQDGANQAEESVESRTEVRKIKTRKVDLSLSLNFRNGVRNNCVNIDDNAGDGVDIRSTRALAGSKLVAQGLDLSSRVDEDADEGLDSSVITTARASGRASRSCGAGSRSSSNEASGSDEESRDEREDTHRERDVKSDCGIEEA